MTTENLIPIIGLDFIQADGRRNTSCQLLDGKVAVATAQFYDGKLSGHRSVFGVELPLFFAQCTVLLRNSIPQTFITPP